MGNGTAVRRRGAGTPVRVARWSLAVALAAWGVALSLGGSATADSAYTMKSSAMGVSLVLSNPGFPLVQSIQANTPTAEAQLNSRGLASGYSAAPDPGQDVAELYTVGPSQLCGILESNAFAVPGCAQVAAAIPAYPYAFAQAGDKPDDQNFAGAHLHAEATESSAEAQTTVGEPGAASAQSTARAVAASDGSTTTSAVTSVDSLAVGSAVRLTGIRSVATATRDISGHLKLTSSFDISHLHVNGMDIGYDDGTFTVLGQKLPVAIPVQTVLSALKGAGITGKFLPATRSKTGITSGGLMVSFDLPGVPQDVNRRIPQLPIPLPIGVGLPTTPTTVTYVLGRTEVTSTYVAIPGGDTGLVGGTGGTTVPPVAGTTGGTTTPPIASGTSSGIPPLGGTGGTAPSTGAPPPPPATATAAATGAAVTSKTSSDIYLAVVLAALAVFGSASAIRYLGVRLSWNS